MSGSSSPLKVLVLDMQGTLGTAGFQRMERKKLVIRTQHEMLEAGFINEEGGVEDGFTSVPVINGISPEKTIEQLNYLIRRGVQVFIATGDGGSYEEGMMGPEEAIKRGVPLEMANVVSFARLSSECFLSFLPAELNGKKNILLDYISKKTGGKFSEMMFLDDGPGNVTNARKLPGMVSERIDIPSDLTRHLDSAITRVKRASPSAHIRGSSSSATPLLLAAQELEKDRGNFGIEAEEAPRKGWCCC